MPNNLSPAPLPTRIPFLDSGGLVNRAWIAYLTWLDQKFALLDSPRFTGGPTVPTAPAGTNTTQIANTAFVTAAVLVETNRAEGVEGGLSTSIATETSRATSAEAALASSIALAAPKANPTFTETVTQPHPSVITAATIDTSATAGTASALPSNPAGYLEMTINGVVRKVPFFA